MRLSTTQRNAILDAIHGEAGLAVRVLLFGSRLDDSLRGGDVDLMVEFSQPVEHPALMSARLATRALRALGGRKVDVVISAPNLLRTSIHEIAYAEGEPL